MDLTDLNDVERAVLVALDEHTHPGEWFTYFKVIERDTGLSRDFVRAACRSLTDKGLATYSSALFSEDGETQGSGYAITDAGRALKSIDAKATQAAAERKEYTVPCSVDGRHGILGS